MQMTLPGKFFEKCILGNADINKDWDQFISNMKATGIEEILTMLNEVSAKMK